VGKRKKDIDFEITPRLLVDDLRVKLTQEEKEEILSLKGVVTTQRAADLYCCGYATVYRLWNPKYREKEKERNKDYFPPKKYIEIDRRKQMKFQRRKKLKEAGLL